MNDNNDDGNDDEKKPPYEVGYGKPPMASRFPEGKSGNLKGRPKGAKNFGTALEKELRSRVPITENGKRRTISKQEAIAKQLVNKGASGDPRTLFLVLNEIRLREARMGNADLQDDVSTASTETDEEITRRALERFSLTQSKGPSKASTRRTKPKNTRKKSTHSKGEKS